jgi:hypothetical protein
MPRVRYLVLHRKLLKKSGLLAPRRHVTPALCHQCVSQSPKINMFRRYTWQFASRSRIDNPTSVSFNGRGNHVCGIGLVYSASRTSLGRKPRDERH